MSTQITLTPEEQALIELRREQQALLANMLLMKNY